MNWLPIAIAATSALLGMSARAGIPIGAAPKGDATAIATRIIKYNFPACKVVSGASRLSDGSIRATCDGIAYRVFTVFNAEEGQLIEVAMNCAAARKLIGQGC